MVSSKTPVTCCMLECTIREEGWTGKFSQVESQGSDLYKESTAILHEPSIVRKQFTLAVKGCVLCYSKLLRTRIFFVSLQLTLSHKMLQLPLQGPTQWLLLGLFCQSKLSSFIFFFYKKDVALKTPLQSKSVPFRLELSCSEYIMKENFRKVPKEQNAGYPLANMSSNNLNVTFLFVFCETVFCVPVKKGW